MKYAIIFQEAVKGGTRYDVILQANDGYEEKQSYVGANVTVLEVAVRAFQAARDALAAKIAAPDPKVPDPKTIVYVDVP